MLRSPFQTRCWNSDPGNASGTVNFLSFPAKYSRNSSLSRRRTAFSPGTIGSLKSRPSVETSPLDRTMSCTDRPVAAASCATAVAWAWPMMGLRRVTIPIEFIT